MSVLWVRNRVGKIYRIMEFTSLRNDCLMLMKNDSEQNEIKHVLKYHKLHDFCLKATILCSTYSFYNMNDEPRNKFSNISV